MKKGGRVVVWEHTSGSPVVTTTILMDTDSTTKDSWPDANEASSFFSFPLPRPKSPFFFFFSTFDGGERWSLISRGIDGKEAGMGRGGG